MNPRPTVTGQPSRRNPAHEKCPETEMTKIPPTVGRIVLYRVSATDAETINQRRADAKAHMHRHRTDATGVVVHVGNEVTAGEIYPAMIVRVWGYEMVNLKVELDGSDAYWATSRHIGDEPGQWRWMDYQLGQAARTAAAEAAAAARS